MVKAAYLHSFGQPIGGASGSMLLGVLADLGLPLRTLKRELAQSWASSAPQLHPS